MKNTSLILLLSVCATTLVSANPRGGPARPPGGVARPAAVAVAPHAGRLGDLADLAAHRDKFDAFRRLNFMGAGLYTKADARLLAQHAAIYTGIEAATNGERLGEEKAESLIDELLAIGKRATTLRGDAEALNPTDAKEIHTALTELASKAKAAAANKVEAAVLSPDLNRSQWTMRELVRFGQSGGMSQGKSSSLDRKLDNLLAKEDKAKADGQLSDRERSDLFEQAHEIWRDVIRSLD